MKIGIVTVHDSNNYGSFLQAYAIQKVLEEQGHEVFFTRTRDKKLLKSIFIPKILQKRFLKHPLEILQQRKNGKEKRKAFLEDQKVFREIDSKELEKMDLVILGSDEIWNVQVPTFREDVFYGAGLEHVIAYAVSVGRAKKEEVFQYKKIIENIREIPDVLVRDSQTQKIVEGISGNMPEVVCDPTLLVDKSVFKSTFKSRTFFNEKYLLVYSYGIDRELRLKIERFANENSLKIVSACFYYPWMDYNIMCGPLEFCEIIQRASYVITTTFHGTIFSILNEKQFVSFPASIKTNDLLIRLRLEQRMVDSTASVQAISNCLKQDIIDYAKVNKKIADFREYSLKLLQDSIKRYGE